MPCTPWAWCRDRCAAGGGPTRLPLVWHLTHDGAQDRPLRVAFVTSGELGDRASNFGTPYYMARGFRRAGVDVIGVSGAGSVTRRAVSVASRVMRRLLGIGYSPAFSVVVAVAQRYSIGRAVAAANPDVVFAPFASTQVAFLASRVPIIYSSDTTLRLIRDYYPGFDALSRLTTWEGEVIERNVVSRSAGLVYPSAWAAESAVRDYGARRDTALIVPYGANLDDPPDRGRALTVDRGATCSLSFIAVAWVRKGGSTAVATLNDLRSRGIPAHLTVVGCEPPSGVDRTHITVIPRIDKSDPVQRATLSDLYFTSYFSILPTRADCSPVVCCEASAHGTPMVITDTGGVSAHVTDGVNGFLVAPHSPAEAYACRIADAWTQRDGYAALVVSSRREYERRLNWDAWTDTVLRFIASIRMDARSAGLASTVPRR
jgi:glycosyltransferase involved in cell wall biosynthesis